MTKDIYTFLIDSGYSAEEINQFVKTHKPVKIKKPVRQKCELEDTLDKVTNSTGLKRAQLLDYVLAEIHKDHDMQVIKGKVTFPKFKKHYASLGTDYLIRVFYRVNSVHTRIH